MKNRQIYLTACNNSDLEYEKIIAKLFPIFKKIPFAFKPFKNIELDGLIGLGSYSLTNRNQSNNSDKNVKTESLFYRLHPHLNNCSSLRPLNPQLKIPEKKLTTLVYFDSIDISCESRKIKNDIKMFGRFGPILEKAGDLYNWRISGKITTGPKPSFQIVSNDEQFVPLYEKDFDLLESFFEKYS